jgi:2-phospho-L-lactate guanylyltransferase
MTLVVVPFHEGKSRLSQQRHVRRRLGLAMLGDVLAACVAIGRTIVVTDDPEAAREASERGADLARDPGDGQGAAVAAALAEVIEPEPVLVVNADVPCAVPHDLRSLLAATPLGGIALVEALDGTTNALSLPSREVFAPLYGAGSGERFLAHARGLGLEAVSVAIPNLRDDVDTIGDLDRLQLRLGPRTQAVLSELERELVP